MFKKGLKELVDCIMSSIGTDRLLNNLEFSNNENITNMLNNLWDLIGVLALGLTLVFFILDINSKWALEGRDLNIKSMMSPFLKLGIFVVIISKLGTLMSAMFGLNNWFVNATNNLGIDSTENLSDSTYLNDYIDDLSLGKQVVALIPLIVAFLVTQIIIIIFEFKAIMYKMEFILRIGFAPVAMADIYNGFNTSAVRYIKGILGLILYGGCFMLIPKIGSVLIVDLTETASTSAIDAIGDFIGCILSALVVPIAEVGMLGVAKQLTREAVGA